MAKTFYTDKDIEELQRKGVKSLRVTDDVALTDLAYEKAQRLGIQIVADVDAPPAAPVRPYLSDMKPTPTQPFVSAQDKSKVDSDSKASAASETVVAPIQKQADSAIEQRIRSTVLAKLGNQVDAQLLDNIIHRVVKATGLK